MMCLSTIFQIKTQNTARYNTAQNLNIKNSPAAHCSRKQENKISRFSSNICKTLQFCSCTTNFAQMTDYAWNRLHNITDHSGTCFETSEIIGDYKTDLICFRPSMDCGALTVYIGKTLNLTSFNHFSYCRVSLY